MTPADVEVLTQQGEGGTLEFKERLSASFALELVALANTIGGKILLGVRDDGGMIGIKDSNVMRARIQDIAGNCDPSPKSAGGAGGRGARSPRVGKRCHAGAVQRWFLLASRGGHTEAQPRRNPRFFPGGRRDSIRSLPLSTV